MDVVAENEDYAIMVREMYSYYKRVFGLELREPRFTLKISNSMQEDTYFYSSEEQKLLMDKGEDIPDLNGSLIMPGNSDLNFVVLINERQFLDDQYIHTIHHEFTHLYDFYSYFIDFGLASNHFLGIYYWSEYHAKRIGSYIYLKYAEEKYKVDGITLQYCTDRLIREINGLRTGCLSFFQVFMELMSYFGRLSVFQEDSTLYPDPEFPKDLLSRTFGPDIFEIYALLLVMNDYENAKSRSEDFKDIIDRVLENIKHL